MSAISRNSDNNQPFRSSNSVLIQPRLSFGKVSTHVGSKGPCSSVVPSPRSLLQYWKIPACFTDGLSVLPVLSLFVSHVLHFRVQIGFSSRFLVFFRQAFLRQLFDVHIPALCCRAKHGHGSSLSGCEGVSVPPGASDGTNFPRIFASIVGWCSIPRLSAGTGRASRSFCFSVRWTGSV